MQKVCGCQASFVLEERGSIIETDTRQHHTNEHTEYRVDGRCKTSDWSDEWERSVLVGLVPDDGGQDTAQLQHEHERIDHALSRIGERVLPHGTEIEQRRGVAQQVVSPFLHVTHGVDEAWPHNVQGEFFARGWVENGMQYRVVYELYRELKFAQRWSLRFEVLNGEICRGYHSVRDTPTRIRTANSNAIVV